MIRIAGLTSVLLFALTLAVVAQEPEPKAKLHKTPHAVFDAFCGAGQKKDFKTAIDCLTPDALNQKIGHIARVTMEIRQWGSLDFRVDGDRDDKEEAKKIKPIADILDK